MSGYTISKEFHFSAAHALEHLDPSHKCFRLHGHNYIVVVRLHASELDGDAFVLDYAQLDLLGDMLDNEWDHRNLNEVLECYTTAENMAHYLYNWCKERWSTIESVSVSETPKTWATYKQSQ